MDGRHAVSDPSRLARLAAEMPAIDERRVDVWDAREWMTEMSQAFYGAELTDGRPFSPTARRPAQRRGRPDPGAIPGS